MGAIMFLIAVGITLWFTWRLFVKSILWVAEPITEYFDNKEKERIKFENVVLNKLNKIEEKGEKGETGSLIPLSTRCFKCHKQTMYYDSSSNRSKCKDCDS